MSHYSGARRQLTCKNTGIKKVKGGKDDENLKQIIDRFVNSVNRYFSLLHEFGPEDQFRIANGFLEIASRIYSLGGEEKIITPESRTEDFETEITKYVKRIYKSDQYEINKDPLTYQNAFIYFCLYEV